MFRILFQKKLEQNRIMFLFNLSEKQWVSLRYYTINFYHLIFD